MDKIYLLGEFYISDTLYIYMYVLSTCLQKPKKNVAQFQDMLLLLFPSIKYMSHMVEILHYYAGLPEVFLEKKLHDPSVFTKKKWPTWRCGPSQ